MDYTFGIKHPYRGHHYILQNVLIMQAVQVTLYRMENSSSFMEDPADCNALPEAYKLKLAHHLLSLSVL